MCVCVLCGVCVCVCVYVCSVCDDDDEPCSTSFRTVIKGVAKLMNVVPFFVFFDHIQVNSQTFNLPCWLP